MLLIKQTRAVIIQDPHVCEDCLLYQIEACYKWTPGGNRFGLNAHEIPPCKEWTDPKEID